MYRMSLIKNSSHFSRKRLKIGETPIIKIRHKNRIQVEGYTIILSNWSVLAFHITNEKFLSLNLNFFIISLKGKGYFF